MVFAEKEHLRTPILTGNPSVTLSESALRVHLEEATAFKMLFSFCKMEKAKLTVMFILGG